MLVIMKPARACSCMYAQVKMFLRTLSVAVRGPGRENPAGTDIADSVAAPDAM